MWDLFYMGLSLPYGRGTHLLSNLSLALASFYPLMEYLKANATCDHMLSTSFEAHGEAIRTLSMDLGIHGEIIRIQLWHAQTLVE
jgi:hypothetical protein